MNNNDLQLIKENVSVQNVLEMYNIVPNYCGMCVCPIHKDTKPSLKINKNGTYHCFGCGQHGDVVDLLMKTEKMDFKTAVDVLLKRFNLKSINTKDLNYKPKVITRNIKTCKENFYNKQVVEYVKECHKNAYKTFYFYKRGLTLKTIEHFKLGYDIKEKAIVIPYNLNLMYYQRRYINQKRFFKLPDHIAGSEPMFNRGAFKKCDIIFIVESPLCAISIWQSGGVSVPLCGVANTKKLLYYLRDNYYNGTLVLCLDNDIAGENATKELIEGCPSRKLPGLNELKINYVVENIADECKDPNELLMKNADRLAINVKRIVGKIRKD